ncbi:unnamed protein product, partial [Candidula unifasciata]
TGNIREMYAGIKKAIGPVKRKITPLKSTTGEIIKDRTRQLDRWVEHYSELYATSTFVCEEALNAMECLPTMGELDTEPSVTEIGEAKAGLPSGKAPGEDGIPPEILKCSKYAILPELHKNLCQCWQEKSVPQDMRDANIITLYKNKGDRSDCNNYRGIFL